MRIQVGKSESEWLDLVWRWVHTEVQTQQRVFIPAGNTPLPIYRQWATSPSAHLRSLRFLQIDDVLSGPKAGSFRQFLQQELGPYQSQIEWIGEADHLADVALLGVGLNGHVAFHEPSLPRDFYSGCVPLAAETRHHLTLGDNSWGITYGVGAFLRCSKILILARGEQKRQVLRQATQSRHLPIAWIMEHPQSTLIADFAF